EVDVEGEDDAEADADPGDDPPPPAGGAEAPSAEPQPEGATGAASTDKQARIARVAEARQRGDSLRAIAEQEHSPPCRSVGTWKPLESLPRQQRSRGATARITAPLAQARRPERWRPGTHPGGGCSHEPRSGHGPRNAQDARWRVLSPQVQGGPPE